MLAGPVERRVRAEVSRRTADPERRLAETERALADAGRQLDALTGELAAVALRDDELARREATGAAQRDRDHSLAVLLGSGRSWDRTLGRERHDRLVAEVRDLTGVPDVGLALRHAYATLLEDEGRGLGRIAGTTGNIVGKLVVPSLLAPPPGPVLEIGTLFGLFSAALLRQLQRAGDFPTLTVVDPFAGTQVQDGRAGSRDRTGTPVTEEVARHNFAACGLGADEVRVVRGYSADPEVRATVADRDYAVVVVDGDHSAAGVYADLWWVQDLVAPGGVVVMDDWGDPGWPGVAAAGRRYLADGGRLRLLGRVATSAYLRQPGGG